MGFLENFAIPLWLLLTLAGIGLCLSIVIEQAQLLAKFQGARRGTVAGGYNAAMKIMVLNRLGTVLYFLLIALSVDLGAQPDQLARMYMIAAAVIALSGIIVAIRMQRKFNLTRAGLAGLTLQKRPIYASLFATFFGIGGLTIPMILSAANPELRLTLANTGFVFNSIFTIITVFFVESYLAKLIDNDGHEDTGRTTYFVALVFIVRAIGAVLTLGIFWAVTARPDILSFI